MEPDDSGNPPSRSPEVGLRGRCPVKLIEPSRVVFRLEDNRAVVEKQSSDSVGIFEGVARRGKSVRRISPHEYEVELRERA